MPAPPAPCAARIPGVDRGAVLTVGVATRLGGFLVAETPSEIELDPGRTGEHAQAPVADLVAEALDHDRAVARDDARGVLLLAQVVEQVARGALIEVVVAASVSSL